MFYMKNLCAIQSGSSNGRSVYQPIVSGRVTITGIDINHKPFQRIIRFDDGKLIDNKLIEDNKTVHHVVYGKYETTPEGIIRFKGSGKGKHGKSRRQEQLFGHDGVCHSWYSNGRLRRQKYVYDNGKVAYDFKASSLSCTVKDYDGCILYEIKGRLDSRHSAYYGCHSVFHKPMHEWFLQTTPFEVKKKGIPIYAGQSFNNQRVGKWVENGKIFYYEHGVQIPEILYHTPADKLDVNKILRLQNAQVRMALMSKIGPERIADAGKVIHKEGNMRLYDIPNYDVRILRVRCPTTKSFYFLQVPKDSNKCEEARQWTFHVGTNFDKPIKFLKET